MTLPDIDRDALLEDLRALVRIPSLGGHEDAAQAWMADRMRQLGLDVDVWPIDVDALRSHHAFSMEIPRATATGVVGTWRGGRGPLLVLNGHVDVVPIGDEASWSVPPWEATVKRGRVYGRGACDMKGGLACALAAVRTLRAAGAPLAGGVAIQSVVAEEDGGAGTLATLARGHRGDGAICLEPTGLAVAPAQAGALSFRIVVPGRAAHGCVREEGVSAVEKFAVVHQALQAFENDRNTRLRDPLFDRYRLPFALSIGRVRSGVWPSSVPDHLVCEGRVGLAPGEDPAAAKEAFEHTVADAGRGDPWLRDHPATVEWRGGQFLPARTEPDAAIVRATRDAADAVLGHPPRVEGMTYGADMRHLVREGGIPTILFGPGDIRQAHGPDEWIAIDDLVTATRILVATIQKFCV